MNGMVFTAALIASFVGSVGLIIVALIFKVSLDYYLATIGTVVTSLAFGFGTYFVVIAIDAYSQLKVVRSSADDAQKLAGSLKLKEAQFRDLEREISKIQSRVSNVGERLNHSAEKILQIFVDYVLTLPSSGKQSDAKRERLLKQAHCIRYRYQIESEFTEAEDRRMAVLGLAQYEDREALPLLRSVIEKSEDPLLRQACETAIKKMTP